MSGTDQHPEASDYRAEAWGTFESDADYSLLSMCKRAVSNGTDINELEEAFVRDKRSGGLFSEDRGCRSVKGRRAYDVLAILQRVEMDMEPSSADDELAEEAAVPGRRPVPSQPDAPPHSYEIPKTSTVGLKGYMRRHTRSPDGFDAAYESVVEDAMVQGLLKRRGTGYSFRSQDEPSIRKIVGRHAEWLEPKKPKPAGRDNGDKYMLDGDGYADLMDICTAIGGPGRARELYKRFAASPGNSSYFRKTGNVFRPVCRVPKDKIRAAEIVLGGYTMDF